MSRYPCWLILAMLFWSGLGIIPVASAQQMSLTLALTSKHSGDHDQMMANRWRPNPDRGTATSTLSGGRQGATPTVSRTVPL